MMVEHPDQVVLGAELAMNALGIQKTIIGIEQNKMDAVQTIKDACKNCRGISVEVMRTRYPQGSEKQLVQSLTGREVPDGRASDGLSMRCAQCGNGSGYLSGRLRGNAGGAACGYHYRRGENPQNLMVRIGTTF